MTAEPAIDTRGLILETTARLAATRGYHGTSTRDVAEAVGIRQPSLFHHFDSKDAIFAELLERSVGPSSERAQELAATPGPAAPRLCAYFVEDVRDLLVSPFDVRGLLVGELLDNPVFGAQRRAWDALGEALRRMVEDGIRRQELRAVDPRYVDRALLGVALATIWQPEEPAALAAWPDTATELVLRGLLRRPSTYPAVRRRAERLLAAAAPRP